MKKSKNKLIYKVLASVLAIALVVTVIPMTYTKALAEGTVENIAGQATVEAELDPWFVSNPQAWIGVDKLTDGECDNPKTNGFNVSKVETDQTTPKTITLSYDKKEVYVDKLILHPSMENETEDKYRGFPEAFHVDVWDGEKWVEAARATGHTNVKDPVEVTINQTCNIIKITTDLLGPAGQEGQYCLRLSEVQVMGEIRGGTLSTPATDNIAATAKTIKAEEPTWVNDWMKLPMLTDGKTDVGCFYTSEFTTEQNTPKEIQFNYDKSYKFDRVVLHPAKENGAVLGFPVNLTISIWDGSKWREVANLENMTVKEPYEIQFPSTEGNAICLTATKLGAANDTQYALMLAEAEIYGNETTTKLDPPSEDIAASASEIKAEVPGWVDDTMKPPVLTDGNKDNFYTSEFETNPETGKVIQFNYSQSYKFDRVVLHPAKENGKVVGFPTEYTISVWDGSKWAPVAYGQKDKVAADAREIKFIPTEGNAICLTATKLGETTEAGKYALMMAEVEIYGTPTGKTLGTPMDMEPPAPPDDPTPEDPDEPAAENVAPKAAIKAETPDWVTENWMKYPMLVDGNKKDGFYTSEFTTKQNTTKVIQFNYEKSHKFDRVVLYPAIDNGKKTAFPVDLSVSVWDGSQWVTVASLQNITVKDSYEIKFAATEGNALCLTATRLGETTQAGKYALMLAEAEIYGKETATVLKPAEDVKVPVTPEDPGDPGEPATENIAPRASIKAETPGWVTLDWMKYPMLVDGNKKDGFYTSEFMSQQNVTKVIQFNYEKSHKFDRMVFYPARENGKVVGFPVDFNISVWNGSSWVVVAKVENAVPSDGYEVKFDPIEGNAICLTATKLGQTAQDDQYALMLAEAEIYGKETATVLAPAQDVVVPTPPEDSNNPSAANVAPKADIEAETPGWVNDWMKYPMLVDGNTNEGFYTSEFTKTPNATKIIQFNFKEAYIFHRVVLYPARENGKIVGFPVDFNISVWNGSNWVVVANVTNAEPSKAYEVELSPIEGNAVRLTVTKLGEATNAGEYALMLAEMKILATLTGNTLPAAPSAGLGAAPSGGDSGDTKGLFDNTQNVAFGCPVMVSSDFTQYSCDKENLTDGKADSFWATNGLKYKAGKEEFAEVNLLENYEINKIILLARPEGWGFPIDFTVSIFYDGQWKEVINEKDYQIDEDAKDVKAYEFEIPATIGNKIRIASSNYRDAGVDKILCLNELVAYGTPYEGGVIPNDNLVLINSTVTTSSSIEDYAYYRQNLNDGDYKSEWSTMTTANATEENWTEVELIREFPVSEIQIKPAWGGNGFPLDFKIQVCENGDWVTVYTAENYEKPMDEAIQRFQFDQRRITAFRIVMDKMERFGGLYSAKLAEVMAYREPVGDDFDLDALKGGAYDQQYAATTYKDVLYDENGNIVDAEGNILIPASLVNVVTVTKSGWYIVLIVVGIAAILGSAGAIFWVNKKKKQMQQDT